MKKIGIVSWPVGENSFGITTPYLEWLDMFGQVRILDYSEDFDPSIDLLVLPGGPDVDSARYGQKPNRRTGKPCPFREYFDEHILPTYIDNFVPTFGICRGFQSLNVFFNGTLNQHYVHETNDPRKRWEEVHNIEYKVSENNKITTYTAGVNSIHHQIIDKVGEGLKVIARHKSPKSNKTTTVEALIHTNLPVAMVQFHPEELLYNHLANSLIKDLLDNFNHEKYLEV